MDDWTVPAGEAVGSWQETYDLLSGEDRRGLLRGEALDRLAESAYLVGREEESVKAWARAHAEHAARGDAPRAARSAFWLAFTLMNRGDHAQAGGWVARVQRILAEPGGDCAERGYLLGMAGMERMAQGDPSEALALFRRSAEVSRRFGDIEDELHEVVPPLGHRVDARVHPDPQRLIGQSIDGSSLPSTPRAHVRSELRGTASRHRVTRPDGMQLASPAASPLATRDLTTRRPMIERPSDLGKRWRS